METVDHLQSILITQIGLALDEADIRPSDNFIDMGGNSMMALQIAVIIKENHGVNIDIGELLSEKISTVAASALLRCHHGEAK